MLQNLEEMGFMTLLFGGDIRIFTTDKRTYENDTRIEKTSGRSFCTLMEYGQHIY